MDKIKQLPPFGMRDKFGYALGDFGCNMSFSFISNYLMLFYVTCMGLKPSHYAVIIILAKIFDAVNDPIIGGLCDSGKPGKNGKFKPWIKWASLPLLLSSVAIFIYVPNANYGVKVAMCLGLYCVWSVAYTSVNVPYGALQSVITNVPNERASLSTWRNIGAMAAMAPIMVILPILIYDDNGDPKGNMFIYFVGVMGVMGFAAFYGLRKLTVERIAPKCETTQKINYLNILKAFFTNRHMLGLTISTVAYLSLMMTVSNSMQYLFMVYFQNTALIPIASLIAASPIVIGIVFASSALKKFSKKQLCTYPFIMSIIASAIVTFVQFKNPYIWIILMAFTLFGMGFYIVLTWALVSDCIDFQERKTGRREEGSIYATYSFFRKVAQGVGGALISLCLGWTGYDEALKATEQLAGTAENIYFMTGFLPLVGAIISLLSMHFLYKLDDNAMEVK